MIIFVLLLSLLLSLIILPWLIRGLQDNGILTRDYYKRGKVYIPTHGGIIILFVSVLMITLYPLILRIIERMEIISDLPTSSGPLHIPEVTTAMAFVVLAFGLFGMVDDYINLSRPLKVILPFLFTIPMAMLTYQFSIAVPLFGTSAISGRVPLPILDLVKSNIIYGYLIVPIYIVATANLVNMHSGFNGLATGTASIVLISLIIKSILIGSSTIVVVSGAVCGAGIALWWFNRYPARVIEGNMASLMLGAAIAACIVVQGFIFSGFIMLLPHTVNFLMYFYWRIQHWRYPWKSEYLLVKFGTVRADGTLVVPNKYTLKWVLPHYFNITEPQATYAMYLLTAVFCVVGVVLPF
jgi:UDP-N-acetylglucosamine--dolichyl-phosphate N-acetylglucosaminephosphotransferase